MVDELLPLPTCHWSTKPVSKAHNLKKSPATQTLTQDVKVPLPPAWLFLNTVKQAYQECCDKSMDSYWNSSFLKKDRKKENLKYQLVLSTSPLLSFSNWNSHISLTFSSFCCHFYLLIVIFLDSVHLFELLFWIRCRPQLVQPVGFNQLLPFYSESLDMQMNNRRPHMKTDLLCIIII